MPDPLITGLLVGVGLLLYSLFRGDDKPPSRGSGLRYVSPTRPSYRRDPVFVQPRSQPRAPPEYVMPGPLIAGLLVCVCLLLYSLFKPPPSGSGERYASPTRPSYRRDPVFAQPRSQPRADNGIDQQSQSRLNSRAAQASPATDGIYTPNADEAGQSDAHYTSLRARAVDAGDEMARAYAESQIAWDEGRRAHAKTLSNHGRAKRAEMEHLNDEASAWIFRKNNTDREPGEIDLHDLYVKEAVKYADQSIQKARRNGNSEIRLIVGKGLHSRDGAAKLKPAIEELMQKQRLVASVDPGNAGVLIVQLSGKAGRTGTLFGEGISWKEL